MKSKIINLCLILTSLLGYLEWGGNNNMFLFEGEWQILSQLFTDPLAALHPFTVLPIIGQLMLAFTLFQKKPNRTLTFLGIGGIGLLLLFMFVVGFISNNFKIISSTIPFIITAIYAIKYYKRK